MNTEIERRTNEHYITDYTNIILQTIYLLAFSEISLLINERKAR